MIRKKNNFKIIIYTIIVLWILINLIKYPEKYIFTAKSTLITWFNIIVPSLFPFLVLTELLIEFRFVELIGTLLNPLMEPLFNVSGIGAFPFIMSFSSGYPIGVKLVTTLRKNNTISQTEGQRLLSFCSTSGPMFMVGAVSTVMLNNQNISPLIVIPHYLSAITIGLIFKFYEKNNGNRQSKKNKLNISFNQWLKPNNKFSLGNILTLSVKDSLFSIGTIGGFMIFYSIVVTTLKSSLSTNNFFCIFPFLDNNELFGALLSGIFEITIGCIEISSLSSISLLHKIILINFLIGWSGFSVHSQALSFIQNTDLNGKLYIISKLFHGLLSSLYCLLLYNIIYPKITTPSYNANFYSINSISTIYWTKIALYSIEVLFYSVISLLFYGIIINAINNIDYNK